MSLLSRMPTDTIPSQTLDSTRDRAFASNLTLTSQSMLVWPSLVTASAVAMLTSNWVSTLGLCLLLMGTHVTISRVLHRDHLRDRPPSKILLTLRLLASVAFITAVILVAGREASAWTISVPLVFAHAFLAGRRPATAYIHIAAIVVPTLITWTYVVQRDALSPGTLTWNELLPVFAVTTSAGILGPAVVQIIWARWWRADILSEELQQAKQILRELRTQHAELTAAHQRVGTAKTDFLAHVSHELRTPMNGVLGSLDLLKMEPTLTPSQAELVVHGSASARSLLRLLDDLLDLSKVEAGRMDLECTPFSLRELVDDVERMLSPLVQDGVKFSSTINPELPDRLVGDPTRLRQILINLAGNALKFTHDGSVSIHVVAAGRVNTQTLQLAFEVRDTGIGISPSRIPHLFDAYAQAKDDITRKYGGTGLGLALVKQLTLLMGGSIDVQSVPGEGSAFFVRVPLARVTTPVPQQATHARPAESLTILVVDDNATNRLVAVKTAEALGHRVRVAPNGLAGVQSFHEHGADVILMDCFMPRLNGFDATERIRALHRPVCIIGVTASTDSQDRQRCLSSGMDDVLHKPFTKDDLARMLQKCLTSVGPHQGAAIGLGV